MKSAYELAMERLNQSNPSDAPKSLSEGQKREIAAIDARFQAKIAERDLFIKEQIANAAAAGQWEEEPKLLKQLASERTVLLEEMEEEKDKVRTR